MLIAVAPLYLKFKLIRKFAKLIVNNIEKYAKASNSNPQSTSNPLPAYVLMNVAYKYYEAMKEYKGKFRMIFPKGIPDLRKKKLNQMN